MPDYIYQILAFVIPFIHFLGVLSAIDALYWSRIPQSAIAWGITLVMFPYLALPAYWTFGRAGFKGYEDLLNEFRESNREWIDQHEEYLNQYYSQSVPLDEGVERSFEAIADTEFTGHNSVELLIDGTATFDHIKKTISEAKNYIAFQFFIIRDDKLGRELKNLLIKKSREGVRVYFLYDEIGSSRLPSSYIADLRAAGVRAQPFATRQGLKNFFQFNFRNHRKVVIVDGDHAYVGGHNVGDEYLGESKKHTHWRDTHIYYQGPAVLQTQTVFSADWYWATQEVPEFRWKAPVMAGDVRLLPLSSGPIDVIEKSTLFFLEAIHSAKKRVWISSPYFVPNESIVQALQLASLRGVDVRVLLPEKPDHVLVWLASFYYLPDICRAGVKVYRYHAGFLHQKALIVDDILSAIGTANMDNRSFRLNFELMILAADQGFQKQVVEMFEEDFKHSTEEPVMDLSELRLYLRLGSKFSRLFSPLL